MDYMEKEQEYFSKYVNTTHFGTYDNWVEIMRLDKVWGGNLCIQAMSEMYGRTATVFVYSEEDGCRIGKW